LSCRFCCCLCCHTASASTNLVPARNLEQVKVSMEIAAHILETCRGGVNGAADSRMVVGCLCNRIAMRFRPRQQHSEARQSGTNQRRQATARKCTCCAVEVQLSVVLPHILLPVDEQGDTTMASAHCLNACTPHHCGQQGQPNHHSEGGPTSNTQPSNKLTS
jgi:hypothetical protein